MDQTDISAPGAPAPAPPLSHAKQQQILAGARIVFTEDGYGGASMSRIAAAAGVSKGTLYNYFPGKRELFTAFMQVTSAETVLLIFDQIDSADPPERSLRRICERLLEVLTSDAGLLIYRMVVGEASRFPELAEAYDATGPRRAIAAMAAWIRAQAAAGRLAVDDPSFAAEQLFGLMQTRYLQRRRLGLPQPAGEPDARQVAAAAVSLFLRAYAPR
jgi:AcrR family transcriptional regulator